MIKKSTLIILLAAVILGAAAYFFDWKRGQKDAENGPSDTTKPAFTLRTESDDFSSLTISYPADPKSQPIHFEKQDGAWQITQPLQTSADDASLQGIVQQLASARVAQTEPGTPDRLKVFGLDPADVVLDFQMKSGAKHSLRLGKKDFTGVSVYAIADNAKDVVLLPESLLASADKPAFQRRRGKVFRPQKRIRRTSRRKRSRRLDVYETQQRVRRRRRYQLASVGSRQRQDDHHRQRNSG
jgi:hypothetical protein